MSDLNRYSQAKKDKQFLRSLSTYMSENLLELVHTSECKLARNGLTNWKTFLSKHF